MTPHRPRPLCAICADREATTITDWSRKELVVPNKEFVTGQLVNWSLLDSMIRIEMPIGIAYGSDTALAKRVLLKVAEENAAVLK